MAIRSRRDFLRYAAAASATALAPTLAIAGCQGREAPKSDEFLKAVTEGNLASVRKMLAEDARLLAAKDTTGKSAYALALLHGHTQVAGFLAESGYSADLHEAALAHDWKRFDELTSTLSEETLDDINSDHPIGGTAMFAAATSGAGSDMWRVYAVCGDPNISPRGETGVTALQTALRYPDLPTAEITAATLLSNATDPNPAANADRPPLHIAAERGSTELVEMLIRVGADVRAADQSGNTALQVAQSARQAAVVQMLTEHESIPRTHRVHHALTNASGEKYLAPDISAISIVKRRQFVGQSHGNLQFVTDALREDSRLAHSVALTSEICVEACAHTGRKPIVDVLLDHGAPYSLPTAVMRGDLATAKEFLKAHPERIHERGAHDFALLWYPVIGNCPVEMMELLLDHGAGVQHQHYLGTTALHWACQRGRIEMVELLIANGANVNRVGRKFSAQGETPLATALGFGENKIADLLKNHGAKESL